MKTKNEDPVAAVEKAKQELEQAEIALAALDIRRGDIDTVVARRRDLQARAELARERLVLATARADEAEFEQIEKEILELQEQQVEVESAIESERGRVSDELNRIFLRDWLFGEKRYASCPPAAPGLISMSSSVLELEERRAGIVEAIRRLEDRTAEVKAQRSRAEASARVESRRRLLAGERVSIPLTAWRLFPLEGYSSETASVLHNRKIPVSIVPGDDRQLHCLLPAGTMPGAWMSCESLLRFEEMDPDALTPTMAEIWRRSR